MQLRLVLIGAALLIAVVADLLALRIGQTEYRDRTPTKGHQVGHGRISSLGWTPTLFFTSRETTRS